MYRMWTYDFGQSGEMSEMWMPDKDGNGAASR